MDAVIGSGMGAGITAWLGAATGGFDPVFPWLVRLGLSLLFGVSLFHKLRDFERFVATVRGYRLLPTGLSRLAATAVAAAEGATTAALVVPTLQPLGAELALLLLSLYCAAIGVNLMRGRRDIDCGCMGPTRRQALSPWLLARNGVLAIGAVGLLCGDTARVLTWVDAISIAAALCVLVLVWNAAHELELARPKRPPETTPGGGRARRATEGMA